MLKQNTKRQAIGSIEWRTLQNEHKILSTFKLNPFSLDTPEVLT